MTKRPIFAAICSLRHLGGWLLPNAGQCIISSYEYKDSTPICKVVDTIVEEALNAGAKKVVAARAGLSEVSGKRWVVVHWSPF